MPSASHIQFEPGKNGLSLVLARNEKGIPVVASTTMPAIEGDRQRRQDHAAIFNDLSGGMGFSRRVVDNVYAFGDPVYARSPGLVMPPGRITNVTLPSSASPALGPITATAEYGSDLYFTAGPYILKATGGTGVPVVAAFLSSVPNTRYDSLVVFNGCLYAGGQAPPNVAGLAKFDGTTWTVSTTVLRRFLATVWWVDQDGLGAFRLIGTDGDASFRYVADDPMDPADWTPGPSFPGIQVGNTSYPINSVAASNRHVFFVKSNGIHDVDGRGHAPNLTPYWEQSLDIDNGNVSLVHDAKIFASHFQGLDRVDVSNLNRIDEPQWIHPGAVVPNETPIFGPVVGLCSDSGWLVAAFYNGNNSYILYGQDREKLGVSTGPPWIWHGSEATIRGERVTHLRVTSLDGNPRLWIASVAGTTPKLRWMVLPKASSPLQDYLNGGPWRPADEFSIYLPADDFGNGLASKTLLNYKIRADQLGNSFLEVFASLDARTFNREAITTNSPIEIADGSGRLVGFDIGLRVDGYTRFGVPPLLRALEVRASVHVKPTTVMAYTVMVSDRLTLLTGSGDDYDALEKWDRLDKYQMRGPIEFVDEWGELWLAEMQEGLDRAIIPHPHDDRFSMTVTFRMNLLNRISKWNDGSRYNGRFTWARDPGPIQLRLELTGGGILLRWTLNTAPLTPFPPVIIVREPPGGTFVPGPTVPGDDFEWPDDDADDDPDNPDSDGPGQYCYYIELPDGTRSNTVCIEVPPTGPAPLAATFSVQIVRERVLNLAETAYVDLFTVYCRNTTPGTWLTYAWTATGTDVSLPTGVEPDFLTSFSTLTGAAIGLTLTGAGGSTATGSVTDLLAAAADGIQIEEMGIAEATAGASFDGASYNTDAASDASLVLQTAGPAGWGTTSGITMRSDDNLATSAAESEPFNGQEITADWMEMDISTTLRVVGADDGRIAISTDGGATWDVKSGPSIDDVLRVIASRFTAGQYWVLTESHVYISNDGGDTWTTLLEAGTDQVFTDMVLAPSRNVVVGYDTGTGLATMQKIEDGAFFTLPAAIPVLDKFVAVQAHIFLDKFFAYDDSIPPRTVFTLESGGFALGLGTTMPASVTAAELRGMDHTMLPGEMLGGGGNVAWKWLRFGGELSSFFLLRKANVAGAGAGPFPMVRHGALAEPPEESGEPATTLLILILTVGTASACYSMDTDTGVVALINNFSSGQHNEFTFLKSNDGLNVTALGQNSGPRIHKSTDRGDTWTRPAITFNPAMSLPGTFTYLFDANVGYGVNNSPASLYQTTDGGANFNELSGSGAITTFNTGGGIFWYLAGGVLRWTTSTAPSFPGTDVSTAGIPGGATFFSGSVPWVAHDDGSFCLIAVNEGSDTRTYKVDQAGNWTTGGVIDAGVLSTQVNLFSEDGLTWIAAIPTGAGTPPRLMRSTDYGATWTTVQSFIAGSAHYVGPGGGTVPTSKLAYASGSPRNWFAMVQDNVDTFIDVWRSLDDGVTWSMVPRDGALPSPTWVSLCPVGP